MIMVEMTLGEDMFVSADYYDGHWHVTSKGGNVILTNAQFAVIINKMFSALDKGN